MNIVNIEIDRENIIKKVCNFLEIEKPVFQSIEIKDIIKELCVIRLCKTIGLTGKVNFKSKFFDFFASVVGQAICVKLKIGFNLASIDLRFQKYNGLNLVDEIVKFFNSDSIEEAFLDAFELLDKYKDLM